MNIEYLNISRWGMEKSPHKIKNLNKGGREGIFSATSSVLYEGKLEKGSLYKLTGIYLRRQGCRNLNSWITIINCQYIYKWKSTPKTLLSKKFSTPPKKTIIAKDQWYITRGPTMPINARTLKIYTINHQNQSSCLFTT